MQIHIDVGFEGVLESQQCARLYVMFGWIARKGTGACVQHACTHNSVRFKAAGTLIKA